MNKHYIVGTNEIDLIGRKFNLLTVKERMGRKDYCILWKCQCECGKEIITAGERLRSGSTRSCGCLRKSPPYKIKDRKEAILKNLFFKKIKKRSKNIEKPYDLSFASFCELVLSKCYYCGEPHSQISKDEARYKGKTHFMSDTVILHNGIDRILMAG